MARRIRRLGTRGRTRIRRDPLGGEITRIRSDGEEPIGEGSCDRAETGARTQEVVEPRRRCRRSRRSAKNLGEEDREESHFGDGRRGEESTGNDDAASGEAGREDEIYRWSGDDEAISFEVEYE